MWNKEKKSNCKINNFANLKLGHIHLILIYKENHSKFSCTAVSTTN